MEATRCPSTNDDNGSRAASRDKIGRLREKAASLPDSPGVYMFLGRDGAPIYVGKATSLRSRVRSYFHSTGPVEARVSRRTELMLSEAVDLDFILTDTELEALILECNLIKRYRPRFNILLRDDKHYPYIRVSVNEEWPRAVISRSAKKDGARYFGPYYPASKLNQTLKLARRLFPLRTCGDHAMRNASRPCLNYHIGTCPAPCAGLVSREEYCATVRDLCAFLEGKHDEVLRRLNEKMRDAAERLEFEKACQYRDLIRAIQKVAEEQKAISTSLEDQDVVGVAWQGEVAGGGPPGTPVRHGRRDSYRTACVMCFMVRGGKILGRKHYLVEAPDGGSVLVEFIKQHYRDTDDLPEFVLLPYELEQYCPRAELALLERWLAGRRGGRVKIAFPKRGERRRLVELCARNASAVLESAFEFAPEGVRELGSVLGLGSEPYRIECYDVSHHHGSEAVGAMVVLEGYSLNKAAYRRFRIRPEVGESPANPPERVPEDDCARLRQVLARRLKRGLEEERGQAEEAREAVVAGRSGETEGKSWSLPDLIVVDGGKPQLGAALSVMDDLGVPIPVCAIAKENEEVFVSGSPGPLPLEPGSPALLLLQKLRDEAHRFAVTYHRRERRKGALKSVLDEMPGIGPARKKALLRKFGSVNAIRGASVDEIAATPGMTRKLAEELKRHLGG